MASALRPETRLRRARRTGLRSTMALHERRQRSRRPSEASMKGVATLKRSVSSFQGADDQIDLRQRLSHVVAGSRFPGVSLSLVEIRGYSLEFYYGSSRRLLPYSFGIEPLKSGSHLRWSKSVVASQQPSPLTPSRHRGEGSALFPPSENEKKSQGGSPLRQTPANARMKGWVVA